ncbi:FAD-dependent monooxygenase [Spirillospora sp. CA-255316]
MTDERVSVLIVGAGYAGLTAAAFLAWRGVTPLLVERRPSTSIQPKAFGLSWRTMELLGQLPGLRDALMAASLPDFTREFKMASASSLADPEPEMFLGDDETLMDDFAAVSPAPFAAVAQAQGERVIRQKAEEFGADLRFSTELVSIEQDAEGVTAVIRDAEGETTVHADYVVAADGHRSHVRRMAGIPTLGNGDLNYTHVILFKADLTELMKDRKYAIWYLHNDVFDGALLSGFIGEEHRHSLAVNYYPDRGQSKADFTLERCVELARVAADAPDLNVEIVDHADFPFAHVIAERFHEGRIFLAGDAAHTMPPTGGQGANTAAQDGHDIAWRLALVLSGQAGPGLLDAYDTERRPVGAFTADQQLAEYAIRMAPHLKDDDTPELADPLVALLGFCYRSPEILAEEDAVQRRRATATGVGEVLLEDPRRPSGAPGTRAPHVPLDRNGSRISAIDLYGYGFTLLAGGQEWSAAASLVAERLGVTLDVYVVGSDVLDVSGTWRERYGFGTSGATLVRPDGFVGWRSRALPADPEAELWDALTAVLAR